MDSVGDRAEALLRGRGSRAPAERDTRYWHPGLPLPGTPEYLYAMGKKGVGRAKGSTRGHEPTERYRALVWRHLGALMKTRAARARKLGNRYARDIVDWGHANVWPAFTIAKLCKVRVADPRLIHNCSPRWSIDRTMLDATCPGCCLMLSAMTEWIDGDAAQPTDAP